MRWMLGLALCVGGVGCDDGESATTADMRADMAVADGPNTPPRDGQPPRDGEPDGPRDGEPDGPRDGEPPEIDGAPPPMVDEAALARIFGAREILQAEIEIGEFAWARLEEERRDTWVPASLTIDGQRFPRVRLKIKGGRGSFRRIVHKAGFRIDLDGYVEGENFHGLRTLTFNNMIQDYTKMRERLASEMFRSFGIPAARVGYLEITVNGRPYGLYSHIESLDDVFLSRLPGEGGKVGLLYEGADDMDLFLRHLDRYDLDAGRDPGREALRELIRAVDASTPNTLEARLGATMDLDQMRRFFAAEVLTGHWDGYAQLRNNYYLYKRARDDKWMWLPWGTDQALKRTRSAFVGPARLFRMCTQWTACREPYAELVEELAGLLEGQDWSAEIDRLAALTEDAFQRDEKTPTRPEQRMADLETLRRYIHAHPDRIRGTLRCLGDDATDADGDGVATCTGDCDDADPSIYPMANDTCDDEIDQDCTGFTDDGQHCPECREAQMPGGPMFLLCHRLERMGIARQSCERFGGKLASIHSQAENDFVTRAAFARRQTRWYLGALDWPDEGEFYWVDETPFDYSNWADGEPNDNGGAEDCILFGQRDSPQWNDVYCGVYTSFVCRMPD